MSADTITTTPEGKLHEGDAIHFLRAVTGWGDIRQRGYERRLSAADIAATINREGASWLDEIDTDGARIGRGSWPAGEPTWTYGSPDWQEQREAARKRAWAVMDPDERAAARKAVELEYGPAAPTSNTLSAPTSSPEQRAADEQRRRLDSGGVRQASNYAPGRRP